MGVKVNYKGSQIASISDSGSKTLKTSGTYCEGDITVQYEKPTASEVTSGTKAITTNGEHDVTSYQKANVNVPIPDGHIKPTGTKSITTNGTHDVTDVASASVNVPVGATNCKFYTVNVTAKPSNNTWQKWVAADADIAAHRNDATFGVAFYSLTAPIKAQSIRGGFYANSPLAYYDAAQTRPYHAYFIRTNASSVGGTAPIEVKLTTRTETAGSCYVNTDGSIEFYASSTYATQTGTYQIIVWW